MDSDRIIDVAITEGSVISFWECPQCRALTLPEGKDGHLTWHYHQMMKL